MIEGTSRPKSRKSKTFGEDRICESEKCEQVLSKYNNQKFCYIHHKTKYPRVRGRILLDNEWTSRVCSNRKERDNHAKKNKC